MARQLHIVNGDSTKWQLEQSSIQGSIIVWREMLSEGPVSEPVFSDAFWQDRYSFFEDELGVSKLEFFDKTIKELLKAEDLEGIDELTLWFEYDLFCQVNLMALCVFLDEHFKKEVNYSLVCVGWDTHENMWKALGDYSPKDFSELYKKRINLSRASLEYAHECWKVYAQKDSNAIEGFNFRKNKRFQYFDVAMQQELKRFPNEKGLNEIDLQILNLLQQGNLSFNEVVKALLIWQKKETVYGFGDLQYVMRLKKLKLYYNNANDVLQLNEKGKQLVKN